MELASNMCPELGTKGYMPHKDITVDMVWETKKKSICRRTYVYLPL